MARHDGLLFISDPFYKNIKMFLFCNVKIQNDDICTFFTSATSFFFLSFYLFIFDNPICYVLIKEMYVLNFPCLLGCPEKCPCFCCLLMNRILGKMRNLSQRVFL